MDFLTRKLAGYVLCADNTTLDSGSGGDDVRTIDKSSVKTPVSALDVGGAGTENLVTDGSQGMPTEGVAAENAAVAGNPVLTGGRYDSTPRTLGDGDVGAIAVDATGKPLVVESSAAGAATSLAVIDDWDESDRAKVNPIVGQAGVAAGAGSVGATVQRVTLASDDPGVSLLTTIDADTGNVATNTSTIAGAVSGTEMQVDVVAALPAGTNAIGKLAANSGVDIGDVDVTSLPSDVAVAEDGALGKGILLQGDDGTDRKNVAVDTDGNVQVDIVSGTVGVSGTVTVDLGVNNDVTVTGSVTANAGTNLNTSALALETGGNLAAAATSLATLDNIVAGNEAQVDVVTVPAPLSTTGGGTEAAALRVTVASDSTGVLSVDDNGGALTVDNAGTFAVQSTLTPATSGGLDTFKSTDIDETEEDVKTSAGLLYWIYCVNTNASARYLKVYNATAANVTVGSTATKLDLLIPPSNSGFFIQFPHGITFSTAISVAATTGVGDADSGAPGANEVQVTVGYK